MVGWTSDTGLSATTEISLIACGNEAGPTTQNSIASDRVSIDLFMWKYLLNNKYKNNNFSAGIFSVARINPSIC